VEYITYFSGAVIQEAKRKNVPVKELKEEKANRDEFEGVIRKLDYRLVVLNGHGSEDVICGHKNMPLVECGKNDSVLKERLVYARSCHAGRKLGMACMKGTRDGCFIGYGLPFMFYSDELRSLNPAKDSIAPIFLQPSNAVPMSLIKGNPASQAHENGKRQMLKNMNRLILKGGNDSLLFAQALWNNYTGQVMIGNGAATI
jgi:hypothetical protein